MTKQRKPSRSVLATGIVGVVLAFGMPGTATAATINVPCTGPGGGAEGLVAAINSANTDAAPDTIVLEAGCTYSFTSAADRPGGDEGEAALPRVTSSITIQGNGARIAAAYPFRSVSIDGGGFLTIVNTTLEGGDLIGTECGGAIRTHGVLELRDVTVRGNTAPVGGALCVEGTAVVRVVSSTISGNVAQGGSVPNPDGSRTEVPASGGAIEVRGGSVALVNSTLDGNQMSGGRRNGATISNGSNGVVTAAHVTFGDDDRLGDDASQIHAEGPVTIENSLMSFFELEGSFLPACVGNVIDGGDNIAFESAGCPGADVDPLLGPLQDNGGPTHTMALGPGSPAIDGVTAGSPACPDEDQRGVERPQDADLDGVARCDIGAFEVRAEIPAPCSDVAPGTSESTGAGDGGLVIVGTRNPDVIEGTPGRDIICGLAGEDSIHTLQENDLVVAGADDDVVDAGTGADTVRGNGGSDILEGAGGRDLITAGFGADAVSGGTRSDNLKGGFGNDDIAGNEGSDMLAGAAGDDTLDGGPHHDVCFGGRDEDTEVNCEP